MAYSKLNGLWGSVVPADPTKGTQDRFIPAGDLVPQM